MGCAAARPWRRRWPLAWNWCARGAPSCARMASSGQSISAPPGHSSRSIMSEERFQALRLLEAMLFATAEPVSEAALASRLPEGSPVGALLEELAGLYANRGVNLVCRDQRWAFRTAPDLGALLRIEKEVPRKPSRAAV